MNQDKRPGSIRRVPPPLVFLLAYIAGEGLHYLAPLPLGHFVRGRASQFAAALFLLAGISLVLISVAAFRAAKTTVIPYRRAVTLIVWGPYRMTRNPMYVGVALIYLGVAAVRRVLWPVLLLPAALAILNYVVIPQEEALLRAAFGEAYEKYCARVRRWL